MNLDEMLARLDSLCTRFEDLLAEMQRVPVKPPNPYAKVRETHPNAGKAWSADDDHLLRERFEGGTAIHDLAIEFGRTPNGIRVRLERLGLISRSAA